MHRKNLIDLLALYRQGPYITSEEFVFYDQYTEFLENNEACFERENKGHITGAGWIVNHDFSQALLTHHKKLNIWCQLGGHADGNPDIQSVALREAQEESGIENLTFVFDGIFDIDVHPLANACSYHYDVRFLLQAPPDASFKISDESHALAWVSPNCITDYTQERSVVRLAQKVQSIMHMKQSNQSVYIQNL